jgi:hypothetical protein
MKSLLLFGVDPPVPARHSHSLLLTLFSVNPTANPNRHHTAMIAAFSKLCEGEHYICRCPYRENAKRIARKLDAESVRGKTVILLSSDSERVFMTLADDSARSAISSRISDTVSASSFHITGDKVTRIRLLPILSRHGDADGYLNVTGIGTSTVDCDRAGRPLAPKKKTNQIPLP